MLEPLLTPEGAMAVLDCSEVRLWNRVREGTVRAYRIGNVWRFSLEVVPTSITEPESSPPPVLNRARRLSRWEECIEDGLAESLHLAGVGIDPARPIVYVLQAGEDGPLKIGWTADLGRLRQRLRSIQTGSSAGIIVRRLFQGGVELERALHAKHRAARIRGEWFRETAGIRRLVEEPGLDHLPLSASPVPSLESGSWS